MTTLRAAAQQALEALENCGGLTKDDAIQRVAAIIALKDALAEPVEPVQEPSKFLDVVTYTGKGAVADTDGVAQEPDSPQRRCGGPGCDGTCCQPVQEPQGCDHCNHPLYAAIKCRVCGRVTEPTPPQRKPLAEWQINDLMADIDPEDRDSWSFRQGVYAAEKHHGVRK